MFSQGDFIKPLEKILFQSSLYCSRALRITENILIPFIMQNPVKTLQERKLRANITQECKPNNNNNNNKLQTDKILANQTQDYSKKVIYHDCVGFIPGMRVTIKKPVSVIPQINILTKTTPHKPLTESNNHLC